MPYTPPSQLSPAASKPTSPAPSRSHSFLKAQTLSSEHTSQPFRPGLPRSSGSATYLSRHRRSPSLTQSQENPQSPEEVARVNGESNTSAFYENGNVDPNGSLRQSPPPVSNLLIPTGATISPPESSHNSSDEEDAGRGRGRELDNLAELQAAIRIIEQRKESSPNRIADEVMKARLALEGTTPLASDNHPDVPNNSADSSRPPLSREARKISHSRSSTDSNIVFEGSQSLQHSPLRYRDDSDEDEDSEENNRSRPAMVRKKSGELVRPALRPPSAKRRPSSMPGTPTYSKAVHFDSHLEHVRHFLQVDRPLAVSVGSSPVENYESEVEFPFDGNEDRRSRGPSYEWEIRVANFPPETPERNAMPVRVERVYLSSDNKNLIGSIAVQNLAFQKFVVARFTLDYWKTTSELVADFNHDVRRKQQNDGCDRFTFSIKLGDQAHLENKTLFFCVRYNVNGQEYWDSNNGINYQVDFSKKAKSQPPKQASPGVAQQPLNALPRSRPSPPASSSRPKSMPASFDDFGAGFENFGRYGQPPATLMGESPIKLKGPRSRADLVPDAPARRHKSNGQAFGNRYDFGASLSAAIQNASTILGEQSGLSFRPDTKQSSREVPAMKKTASFASLPLENGVKAPAPTPGQVTDALAAGPLSSKPAALVSEKPSLQSQSYKELVDKYCFFGSAKSTPPQLTQSALRSLDGANDYMSASDLSTGSNPSSGSSTPTPPRGSSPSPPTEVSTRLSSAENSRSSSPLPRAGPGLSMRSVSPAFGYPYRQPSPSRFLAEAPAATAIHG